MKSATNLISAGLLATLAATAHAAPTSPPPPFPGGAVQPVPDAAAPAAPGAAESPTPAAPAGATDGTESRQQYLDLGPYRLTVGIDEGDAFGAALHGSHVFPLGWFSKGPPKDLDHDLSYSTHYTDLLFDVDAGWSTKQDTLNNASLSFKPSMQWNLNQAYRSKRDGCVADHRPLQALPDDPRQAGLIILQGGPGCFRAPEQTIGISAYGDFRYRYGNFRDGASVEKINQFFGGGGLQLFIPKANQFPAFREWPRISIGYYTVLETSGPAAGIPDGLEADHLTVDASVKLRLPFPNVDWAHSPLELNGSYRGSKPTTGPDRKYQNFGEVTVLYRNRGGQHPAFTYRAGTEQGLKYDRQAIIGLLWELAP